MCSGGSRISGKGGLITIFTSGGWYWRGRAPPVTARGSGGALQAPPLQGRMQDFVEGGGGST